MMSTDETSVFDPHGTYYSIVGSGDAAPPVVFIHGVGLDHTMWEGQVRGLCPHYRVLTYDLLGHGRTAHRANTRTLADYVMQLTDLLDSLAIKAIHLVGFSVGGIIAQRFCGIAPQRLASVAFMNSVYQRVDAELIQVRHRLRVTSTEGAAATADEALIRWFNPSFRDHNPGLMARIRERLITNDLDGYVAAYSCFVNGDEEVGDALTRVTCPALAMTSDGDIGSPPVMCERMARDLRNPSVKVIEGFKHGVPIEGAELVNETLLSFLSGVEASRQSHS